jgi:putative thioredoxin
MLNIRGIITTGRSVLFRSRYVRFVASESTAVRPSVVEVSEATFAQVVMEEKSTAVILDCYANWCRPCKSLTPVLETIANESGGKITLAKLDTDGNPHLSQSLQVKSLPTVFGIWKGKVVSKFVGVPTQEQLGEFVSQLKKAANISAGTSDPLVVLQQADEALNQGNDMLAFQLYQTVIVLEEAASKKVTAARSKVSNDTAASGLVGVVAGDMTGVVTAKATSGLLKATIKLGDMTVSKALYDTLNQTFATHKNLSEVSSSLATYELAVSTADLDVQELVSKLSLSPDDNECREKLAMAIFVPQPQEAIAQALELIKREQGTTSQRGKKLVIQFFNILGKNHPLSKSGRSKLANLMF